ncbi:MAG TPA: LamB/YcsF family protein [Veillonellaceae bacterium]|jgi:UPF0271 protein|nr:LamB/YcsF family protein [Veillonellaceae bacterium]
MNQVDLNSDLGESFGAYTIGQDEKVLPFVTSANIACGFHAGDPLVMQKTIALAVKNHVAVGAHPGLPDLVGFGRRKMDITPQEAYAMVLYQVGALQAFARAAGISLQHVKPHGALYNMAAVNRLLAEAIASAVHDISPHLTLVGLAGSELIRAGESAGIPVVNEVFADRTYQPDGTLTPRSRSNAVIRDKEQAVSQVLDMILKGKVAAVNGTEVPVQADTVCVHGDTPSALLFTETLKIKLQEAGVAVQAYGRNNE